MKQSVLFIRLPDEVLENIKKDAKEKRISVNRYIVESLCDKYNVQCVTRGRRQLTDEDIEMIVELHDTGESFRRIARKLGCSASAVRLRYNAYMYV